MRRRRAIGDAFQEMYSRLGRQSLQILERKTQRPIHQAVNEQTVLRRIDIRRHRMAGYKMQWRRRDDPDRILNWAQFFRREWARWIVRLSKGRFKSGALAVIIIIRWMH